mgnify:CR=1 FL=1
MKSDLLLAVTQLAAERNLPQPIVVKAVEAALASAYKRDPAAQGQDVIVELDAKYALSELINRPYRVRCDWRA